MHSLINAYNLNERLLAAVGRGSYSETLCMLMDGAKATVVSGACGHTAIGTAALVGNAEILELLLQACEEPDLDIFKRNRSNAIEMETDSTPDDMDKLEWEDEFDGDCDDHALDDALEEHISLYYYYAKTFERTGAIMDEYYEEHNQLVFQDPHTVDVLLMTPLHYAAAYGHLDCTRILLAHGAPVDAANSDGYTPLHMGAKYTEVTRLLLKHGANVNLKTINTGETAFHLAIRNQYTAVANVFLKTNININDTDDIDQTPLIGAIISDQTDIAYELIKLGARLNLQDKEGRTALYYAVQQNRVPLAAYLLERGARRVTSHYLLHHCVRANSRQMAELLLRHGENLNVRQDGVTPIMLAIMLVRSDMLEVLLQFANAQHQQDRLLYEHIENELIVAVQYIDSLNEFKTIARLLFAYSDQCCVAPLSNNCYIPFCQTPLARAIMLHKLEIAEFLIKEGMDINQVCRDHVINNLRTLTAPGYVQLAKLLVHAGFKFPYRKPPFPSSWKLERQRFEEEMGELCKKPLNLQSLTRIAIRRHLNKNLKASKAIRHKYHATKQESGLMRMINELDIPKLLKTFLIDFDDCPTVMNRKFHVM